MLNKGIKLTVILTVSFWFSIGFSQTETIDIIVDWSESKALCSHCDFNSNNELIEAYYNLPLNFRGKKSFTYSIVSIDYDQSASNSFYSDKNISKSINLNVDFSIANGKHHLVSTFNPIILNNGQVSRVKSIKLTVSGKDELLNYDREHVFANESVLNSGIWYKIGVSKSGVYKLSKSFLESLGINANQLNPNHINIFGNHQSELPINNNTYRPDDLEKNSIYIEGDSDNSFDANDYILFYATGPMKETLINGEGFNYSLNDYDTLAYYFISVNASDSPKRIISGNGSSLNETATSDSFNEVSFYEKDEINPLHSGRIWLGDMFDVNLEQEFTLKTPNYISANAGKLKSSIVITSHSSSASMTVLKNSQTVDVISGQATFGSYTQGIYNLSEKTINLNQSSTVLNLKFNQGGDPGANAWLDALQINYRREITNSSEQIRVRDWNTVGLGEITKFSISSPLNSTLVWDVTIPFSAFQINTNSTLGSLSYKVATDSLKTFVIFNDGQAFSPIAMGGIANQNLHGLNQVDYLIISPSLLMSQAERLADLHRNKGLTVHVVDIKQVYNEYSSGIADPVAVRWIAKMFYDRANGNSANSIKSLLLFGDGSYDFLNRVEDNELTNLLPTYQNPGPVFDGGILSYTQSYTSDDFFGLLDDLESMDSNDLLDIGIGRLPVSTLIEAEAAVDKIQHYMNFGSDLYSGATGVKCNENGFSSSLGDWRTRSLLIADDEDNGKFVFDCESLSDTMDKKYLEMNVIKVYLDAFQQEATSSGQRYPEAENALNQLINNGILVANYVGHGGERGLTAERVLSIPTIQAWTNINKLPLFVSATCEFSRFDDPKHVSAGEIMYKLPLGGAVALLTTTRLVYIHTNSFLVRNLYSNLYALENNQPLSFGEIIKRSKNLTAGDENMRNFTLLGDPALKIGKPLPNIKTTLVNGQDINVFSDTLKALSKITIEGEVVDENDNLLSSFNGIVYPTLYDKSIYRKTLSQDASSPEIIFKDRTSQLYKGKSTVKNGKFKFTFIVPKDIDYSFGNGKLSYYSDDIASHKIGFDTTLTIGGVDPNGVIDNLGPTIELFMNDKNFVNSGITNENPIFIAKITDESGVNTTGNGIGHDISIILDGQTASPIILNNFYEADLDTYKSGEVNYQLLNLEPGEHTATFKVWDVNNNSSEEVLTFEVKSKEEVAIEHVLNYPNPFVNKTEFFFEHNQVCNHLDTKVEIFTVSGKLVKSIIQTVNTNAFRSSGISWDGTDDFGDRLGRGVYVYKLSISTDTGEKANKLEKLVIL